MMRAMEPTQMMDAVTASMKKRTGRELDEWVALVEAEPGLDPLDQGAVRAWLKQAHGLPQNSQWAIAFAAAERAGWVMPTPSQYADELFTGRKQALRPLHDAVVAAASGLEGTEVQGRGTYTPVVRRTQFVAVAPGPRSTLRVGFRFREHVPDDPRLEPARGFAQATHWVHVPADADPASTASSLEPLLRAAWEQNG